MLLGQPVTSCSGGRNTFGCACEWDPSVFPLTNVIGPVELPPRSFPTEGISEIPSFDVSGAKGVSPSGNGKKFEVAVTEVSTLSSFVSSLPSCGHSSTGSPSWDLSFDEKRMGNASPGSSRLRLVAPGGHPAGRPSTGGVPPSTVRHLESTTCRRSPACPPSSCPFSVSSGTAC